MHHFKAPHDMFENAKRYDSYLEDIEIPEPGNLHNQPAPGFGSPGSRGLGSGLTKNHQSWMLSKSWESIRRFLAILLLLLFIKSSSKDTCVVLKVWMIISKGLSII